MGCDPHQEQIGYPGDIRLGILPLQAFAKRCSGGTVLRKAEKHPSGSDGCFGILRFPLVKFLWEGFITGVGAKMFTIARPVIVYGTAASVVYGFIYWLLTM